MMTLEEINKELEKALLRLDNTIEKMIDDLEDGNTVDFSRIDTKINNVQNSLLGNSKFRETLKNETDEKRQEYLDLLAKAADDAKKLVENRLKARDDVSDAQKADLDTYIEKSNKDVYDVKESFEDINTEIYNASGRQKKLQKELKSIQSVKGYRSDIEAIEAKLPAGDPNKTKGEESVIKDIDDIIKAAEDKEKNKKIISELTNPENFDLQEKIDELSSKTNEPDFDINSDENQKLIKEIVKKSKLIESFDKLDSSLTNHIDIKSAFTSGADVLNNESDLNNLLTNLQDIINTATDPRHLALLKPGEYEAEFQDLVDERESIIDQEWKDDLKNVKSLDMILSDEEKEVLKNGELADKKIMLKELKINMKEYAKNKHIPDSQLSILEKGIQEKYDSYVAHNNPTPNVVSINGVSVDLGEDAIDPTVDDKKIEEFYQKIRENDDARDELDNKVTALIGPMPRQGILSKIRGFFGFKPFGLTKYGKWEKQYNKNINETIRETIKDNKEKYEEAEKVVSNDEKDYKDKLYTKLFDNAKKITRTDKKKARDSQDILR